MSRPERLAGGATIAGTRRGAESFGEGARTLGRTGLTVSPIGFGGSRIRDDDALHRRALGMALDGGVNLVDTSSSYGDGRSETLVGIALAHAVQQGSVRREHVVVVTKLGYLQGPALARARARAQQFEDVVEIDDSTWHCIHPELIREHVADSLARLGLEHIDVLLLHNPECFLVHDRVHADGAARRLAYDDRLRRAFATLEELAQAGTIGWYGVSSNGLPLPEHDLRHTSMQRLVELAREVGGDPHRFGVVQLPMNLLELGAATERHASAAGRTALEVAAEADLGVLINRPLHAFQGDVRVALTDVVPDAPDVVDALASARKLEGAWADDLGRRILTDDGGDNAIDLFRWGRELSRVWRELGDREHWRSLRHDIIAPQLGQASAALLTHLSGDDREAFARWWQGYGTAMHHVFTAIEAWLARPPAITAAISQTLDPLLPTPWRELPLSRKAVLVALSAPIACVLVGMRQPGWVADMLALREHPVRLLSAATGPVAHGQLQARLQARLSRLSASTDAPPA